MKAHRIFTKGQTVYCLLSSFSTPNVLLPIKGLIVDTQWDPVKRGEVDSGPSVR